ncbi:hypothetical protein [Pseudonocardia xishanensis]|uniref:MFS transporter n=1 Tax=Pseudonocardia xishanensis TaxID=630995 RepID=A0ABP8RQM4_9PSEU
MSSRIRPSGVVRNARSVPGSVLRAAVLACLATLLTALGHLAGGGTLPDLALLVVLFPLLAVVVTALAERVRGRLGVLAVLGGGQLVLHELLVLLGHDHGGSVGGPRMLLMHAAATLCAGLLLQHVDRLLAALGRALARVVPRRIPPPRVEMPLPVRAVPATGVRRRAAVGTPRRRGPPVPVALRP